MLEALDGLHNTENPPRPETTPSEIHSRRRWHRQYPIPPSQEIYTELQRAFDHFNLELFDSRLTPCILTLQREHNTRGYYSRERFVNPDGRRADEIALNPEYFAIQSLEETMSTLAHEMAHAFQAQIGAPGRGRYHNREWADLVEDLGLMPSSTSAPGGKRTGDRMSHYIIPGGRFSCACEKLLTEEFRLSWMDRFPPPRSITQLATRGEKGPEGNPRNDLQWLLGGASEPKPGPAGSPPAEGEREGEEEVVTPAPFSPIEGLRNLGVAVDYPSGAKTNRSLRQKYRCAFCNTNVWGKPGLNLICGDCSHPFEAVGAQTTLPGDEE